MLDGEAGIEDGPGWWAARAAIEAAASAEASAAHRWLRTAYVVADGAAGAADPGLVNAGLVLRDERVTGLSERSVSVLRGLLSHVHPARRRRGVGDQRVRGVAAGACRRAGGDRRRPRPARCPLIQARDGEEIDELARDPADRLRRDRPDPLGAPHALPARVRRCAGGALRRPARRADVRARRRRAARDRRRRAGVGAHRHVGLRPPRAEGRPPAARRLPRVAGGGDRLLGARARRLPARSRGGWSRWPSPT